MPLSSDDPSLEAQRDAVRHQLAHIGYFRPGTLAPRYVKCGKPTCRCAPEGAPGHGPYWLLTSEVNGQARCRSVPAAAVERTQQQIAEYHRFRQLVKTLIEVNSRLCDTEMDEAKQAKAVKKKTLEARLTTEIAAEVEDLIGEGRLTDIDFEALERAARRQALEIAAKAVARRLNADHTDQAGSTLSCACGTAAAYAGRRPKTFTTALGEMTLERAYYHCRHCQEGFFPRDRALGMEKRSLSPAVTRMTGLAAAEVSFRRSGEMLQELAGLRVETKQVERTAKALGAEVAEDELCRVEAVQPPVSTLYLGMDGTGVPVRPSECEGRPGKQPDGSSKTREVKLVPVWSTSPQCDQTGRPLHDPDSVSYSAAIESAATGDTDPEPSAFAQRVDREARRRGFPEAQRRVIVGDGAAWIWNIAGELFPGAIEIVDLFHAKGRLWDAAKAIYGPGTDLAAQWARKRCGELEAGRIDTVVETLGAHKNCQEALRCMGYLETNRNRMRYPQFRRQGLSISSGVVESGCKRIVGDRLKRGGMHWTVDGANAIIALKCCLLSGRFEDFWDQRAAAM